jgi:hypothetical protein
MGGHTQDRAPVEHRGITLPRNLGIVTPCQLPNVQYIELHGNT